MIVPPPPSMVVASVLGRTPAHVSSAVEAFTKRFGRLGFATRTTPFPWTDYYEGELGSNPVRRFIALEQPVDPSFLVVLKRTACRIEIALARPGAPREVNIDPGMLNEHQLVVASTKPRAHRVYLGEGVHGDLMLLWRNGGFVAMDWTYPDYAVEDTRTTFAGLRALHLARSRTTSRTTGA